ncbi:Flavonoid 3'-monooxygenase protein [Dioscorea alata]|uniref:Flavonoid 3'-monooxygenase protein n=1 Tax=Dioscorea alata TaxID=55571 RepID=A0ACB7WV82_DIOAL|nr:Flavonoid 3'-monooxygenase protein [Dioscorea alata]
MGSGLESGWAFSLTLAAKCKAIDPSRLLLLTTAILFFYFVTSLIHWSFPGGPAWGRLIMRSHRKTMIITNNNHIPGPKGLPIIGSINLMHGLAHRHLANISQTMHATRLMAFSLGYTRVIITSNHDVAREILNHSAFADRPIKESAYGLMFNRAIGFAPYGVYWRTLRRIAATHLFSPKQISLSGHHRADIAHSMIETLGLISSSSSISTSNVTIRDVLKSASLINVMASVFGRKYELGGSECEEMKELRSLVDEGYDLLGKINWSDHLPFLVGFDLQGIRFRCSKLVPRVNHFVNRIIHQHRIRPANSSPDFVDVLLSLQGSDRLSDPDMVAVLWEMIFRGTDTVAVLIEWVMARLVKHKEVQEKVHEELDRVVGRHRAVTESETSSLVYLNAVIKEVLRLHPPGPLLSWARLATRDVHVDGKLVPAGTTAMVNMWAIMHDPHVWENPNEFRPERFVGPGRAEFPVFGSDLRLAPFGSGRRSCPGKGLALTTVSYWVAALMHEFEWDSPRVDLSEVLRLTCEMAVPLTVTLRPRRRLN